jgi:hypothetical protein
MRKPKPGFYWAKLKDQCDPLVVEFCDEGGDQWFTIAFQDWVIDLTEADGVLTLLASIPPPPDG